MMIKKLTALALFATVFVGLSVSPASAFGTIERVADVAPGPADGDPGNFVVFQNKLFFEAATVAGDDEPHVYDPATDLVSLISTNSHPAGTDSNITEMFVFNGNLYANMETNGLGRELFKYNTGTNIFELFVDLNPGPPDGRPGVFDNGVYIGADLYFSATDDTNGGDELYKFRASDDTIVRVADIVPGAGDSDPGSFVVFQNKLFFEAETVAGDDEPHVYDPATDLVSLISTNSHPTGTDSNITEMFVFNGNLYANMETNGLGRELFKYNTGTNIFELFVDLNPGPPDGRPNVSEETTTIIGADLYFSATDDTNGGDELYKFRASDDTIVRVADIVPGAGDSDPGNFVVFQNKLFFEAATVAGDDEPHVYDPATDLVSLISTNSHPAGTDSNITEMFVFNGNLYANMETNGLGRELFKYNTSTGIFELFVDLNAGPADGRPNVSEETTTIIGVDLYFSATDDANGGDELYRFTGTPTTQADLVITKSDSPDPVIAGTQLTYTVTVQNLGPDSADNVVVTDTLPAGVSNPVTSGCVEDPAGTPTCSLGTIASGTSKQYTITVDVNPGTLGTITNGASVLSSTPLINTSNDSVTENTTVTAQADLTVTKSDSPDPVVAGNQLVYTVTIENQGPSDAASVVVTDTLPAGVSNPVTAGCVEDPTGAPTCSLGTIAAGTSKQYTITVDVDADATGSLTNTASVASGTTLINPADDSVNETTTVVTQADLVITKSDSPDPVIAGSQLTYTVIVQNLGPSDAQNVVVSDTLPAGVSNAVTAGCVEDPTGMPTCTLGTIAAGTSKQYTITVDVDADATGSLTNAASVASDTTLINTGDDSVNETTTVDTQADLVVTKGDSPDPVVAGNQLVYTVTVQNQGPSDAQNVVVSDTLPAGVSNAVTAGCVEDPAGTPTCTLGTIAAGTSKQYTITVDVDADATGSLTNAASVASDTTLINTGDDSVNETTTVDTQADLVVTKSDSPDPVVAGNQLTYTVTVQNQGPSDAQNVVVSDTLPAGVSNAVTAGCVEDPAGTPTCTLGTIAAGTSKQYTITVDVDADATGSLTNTASVESDTTLINTGDDSVNETTTVDTQADLVVTKSDSPDPVVAGNQLTYTVTVQNLGPSDAQSVVVTDTLPAGVSNAVTAGCVEDPNGTPTCTLGTIAAGASKQYTITVDVDAGTSGSLTNTASAASATTLINTGDDTVSETTTVVTQADLVITKSDSPDPVVAGSQLVYTITVQNLGPSDAQGVVVTDTLPAGVSSPATVGCVEDPGGVPTCALGTIAAGASKQYTITVDVDFETIGGTITNTATVASTTTLINTGDDSASESTTVLCVDTDGDGLCDYLQDSDDDNDGVDDGADPEPTDPDLCGDSDNDTCDDCSVGTDDFGPLSDSLPGDDGLDTDEDGACNDFDADDDNDGVDDPDDSDPLDPQQCRDEDLDTCDDCSQNPASDLPWDSFTPDPSTDGDDDDGDGICDAGDGVWFSTATQQYIPGTGNLFRQRPYELPPLANVIAPLTPSFLPSTVNLVALDVQSATELLFAVDQAKYVANGAGGVIQLKNGDVYRRNGGGVITIDPAWDALGVYVPGINAVDQLSDGSFVVAVRQSTGVSHAGTFLYMRSWILYRIGDGIFEIWLNAAPFGFQAIDGVDVTPGGTAVSDAQNRIVSSGGGATTLFNHEAYLLTTNPPVEATQLYTFGVDNGDGFTLLIGEGPLPLKSVGGADSRVENEAGRTDADVQTFGRR